MEGENERDKDNNKIPDEAAKTRDLWKVLHYWN